MVGDVGESTEGQGFMVQAGVGMCVPELGEVVAEAVVGEEGVGTLPGVLEGRLRLLLGVGGVIEMIGVLEGDAVDVSGVAVSTRVGTVVARETT